MHYNSTPITAPGFVEIDFGGDGLLGYDSPSVNRYEMSVADTTRRTSRIVYHIHQLLVWENIIAHKYI